MIPLSFKFLIAPFVDSYYFTKFGKRKTYVCLSTISIGLITILYSYKVKEYLEDLNILYVTIIPFLSCFLLTFLDVSSDGWSLKLVDKEYLGYARSMKLIG